MGRKYSLHIIHKNLRQSKVDAAELLQFLTKFNVDLLMEQETYIFRIKITGLGYERYITYVTFSGDLVKICIVSLIHYNLIIQVLYTSFPNVPISLYNITFPPL